MKRRTVATAAPVSTTGVTIGEASHHVQTPKSLKLRSATHAAALMFNHNQTIS